MKIFLSWSGDVSHSMAVVFREWLPIMFGGLSAFVSSEDIEKGARWANELDTELDDTDFGLLFLTPDNLAAPWLLYEAGALAKSVSHGRCACVLHNVSKSNLTYPLARFQATALERADLMLLMQAINKQLGESGQRERELEERFEALWPRLDEALATITTSADPKAPPPTRTDRELLEELLAAVRLLTETFDAAPPILESSPGEDPSASVPVIRPGWSRREAR